MRRYAWWIVAGLLLALWAWQQRAPSPADAGQGTAAPRITSASPADAATPAGARHAPLSGAATRPQRAQRTRNDAARAPDFLPAEALATLQRIERGGPHPYRQDGGVFQNRERRLPQRSAGYYREYTVDTPGARDRGARRIVAGGDPPLEYFYSDDHYQSFRRFPAMSAQVRP